MCQFDLKFILFYISYYAKYDYCGLQLSMLRLESFIKKYNIRYETYHNTIIFHTFAAQSAETALLITQSNHIITLIMAKIGYIMATAHYEKLEADREWMQEYGCVKVIEENDADEKNRPLWKQLMVALERGDELVISKFSNAIRGARELAMFLEFCRVKVIRVISIHDRIDSNNELFPETKPSDVLLMMGSLPDEALVLRKSSEHVSKLQERMIVQLPPVSTSKERRMDREKTVINLYAAGHPIDEVWKASGFRSRSSVFRILNKHGIKLNRGKHSGPIKKKNERAGVGNELVND